MFLVFRVWRSQKGLATVLDWAVPLKISRITPRSRSMPRYALELTAEGNLNPLFVSIASKLSKL
jgi:hypothetical protein